MLFSRSYAPPPVPVTPSKTINDFMRARCSHYFSNIFHYLIIRFVCFILRLLVRMYNAVNTDPKPSRVKWAVSCVLVGLILAALTWYAIVFNVLYYIWIYVTGPVGSWLAYNMLDYGCLVFGALGIGIAAVCMVFF